MEAFLLVDVFPLLPINNSFGTLVTDCMLNNTKAIPMIQAFYILQTQAFLHKRLRI